MSLLRSQNGWTVLSETSKYLHQWAVPAQGGTVVIPLRRGPAGFCLAHLAVWFDQAIEPIWGGGDDFGWAYRRITGTTTWSNHASGTAMDLNASAHPAGMFTFSEDQAALIRKHITDRCPELRWGGDFRTITDQMHFEILTGDHEAVAARARVLLETARGKAVIEANPTMAQYLAAA